MNKRTNTGDQLIQHNTQNEDPEIGRIRPVGGVIGPMLFDHLKPRTFKSVYGRDLAPFEQPKMSEEDAIAIDTFLSEFYDLVKNHGDEPRNPVLRRANARTEQAEAVRDDLLHRLSLITGFDIDGTLSINEVEAQQVEIGSDTCRSFGWPEETAGRYAEALTRQLSLTIGDQGTFSISEVEIPCGDSYFREITASRLDQS